MIVGQPHGQRTVRPDNRSSTPLRLALAMLGGVRRGRRDADAERSQNREADVPT